MGSVLDTRPRRRGDDSNVADILKSMDAIGTGALLSPDSFKLQLAPTPAKLKPWSKQRFYGLGIFVIDGWLVQNPSFAGYAATMACLPAETRHRSLGDRGDEGA